MSGFDIIGDIHGHSQKLEQLLDQLGYVERDGVYRPGSGGCVPARRVLFLGDFIDRGPDNRRVIGIVRAMVAQGHALALMGNHEYNAVCYHTMHPESGLPLRPHTPKNRQQHQHFLNDYPLGDPLTQDVINWFRRLPLFLELNGIRAVHACWDQCQIDYLVGRLGQAALIDDEFLLQSVTESTAACVAVETVLKGAEVALPEGVSFRDKDGNQRFHIRHKWWLRGATYRDVALVSTDQLGVIPELPISTEQQVFCYPQNAPPVFFGHYWMSGPVRRQRDNVACLDFSAGKGGPLVAYRCAAVSDSGEPGGIRVDRFVTTDDR